MNQLARLSDQELLELIERVYRAVTSLFGAAQGVLTGMSQTATWLPVYDEMERNAAVLLAAGREQNELYRELAAMQRGRIEKAEAAVRLAAIDLGDDGTWRAICEAQAIDTADRRDDPLMKES